MIIANNEYRKLPVGIQSFNVIREEGYLYVDKTDMIWKLANQGFKYNYLSRPRRFGKSVLIDTLQAYFEGRKDLFEGLKIMELEKDWKQYPVIRLDMSRGGATANEVKAYLDRTFDVYEQLYGIHIKPTDSLGNRFDLIIKTAYEQTGLKVAILIDEYDSPLQHSWKTPEYEEFHLLIFYVGNCLHQFQDTFHFHNSSDIKNYKIRFRQAQLFPEAAFSGI